MAIRLYQDLKIKLSRFGTLIVEKSFTHYQVIDISSMNSYIIIKYTRNRNREVIVTNTSKVELRIPDASEYRAFYYSIINTE